jgi:phage tail-like protein
LFLQDNFTERLNYSGSISLMNNAGDVLRRFNFTNAWPVSWEGPALNAGASALAIETLEIAHDGLSLESGDDLGLSLSFSV